MSNTTEPEPSPAKPESFGGVPAIDRALNVLECLSQSRKGYSVSELSRRLGLPKSSVHLILRTLERRGYLQKQSVGGRYKFGMKLVALSRTALDGVELRDEARPALAALALRTGLTVHMGVLERSEIVIIERIESASPIRVVSWIGRRMDLNSTAMGKALIAIYQRRNSRRRSIPASWRATTTAPSGRWRPCARNSSACVNSAMRV